VKKGVKYYYRLNIEDEVFSNVISVSSPIKSLGTASSENEVLIYPNPVTKGSDVNIKVATSYHELILSNNQGNIIQKISVNGENMSIPTSRLNPGTYFLEGINNENQKFIKKLIID
jgi:hypothetical protein